MRERFALIINPHSRKARHDRRFVDNLRGTFGERGPCYVTQSPEELPQIIRDLHKQECNSVFVCGGDGTLRQTLSDMARHFGDRPMPAIGVLNGGTVNVVGRSFGIGSNPRRQLKRVLKRFDAGRPPFYAKRRLLQINEDYGFIFAVGGFSRFIEHYLKHPDPTRFYAARSTLAVAWSALIRGQQAQDFFREFKAQIQIDEHPPSTHSTTNIAAASIRDIGFGSKPFIGADAQKGTFGVLIFHKFPRTLLWHLPSLMRGQKIDNPAITQEPARSIVIQLSPPTVSMVDGDLRPPEDRYLLKTGPRFSVILR